MSSSLLYRNKFLLHLQERQEYDRPVLLKELAYEQPTSAQISQLHNEYAITRTTGRCTRCSARSTQKRAQKANPSFS